jgi:transcriptional regulator with PAS, ATPase and Fis domain
VQECNLFHAHRNKEITPDAWELLRHYHWSGNVRELANFIERAVVLSTRDRITSEDLPLTVFSGAPESPVREAPRDFHDTVVAYKRQVIQEALYRSEGNQSKAASALGLQRTDLRAAGDRAPGLVDPFDRSA